MNGQESAGISRRHLLASVAGTGIAAAGGVASWGPAAEEVAPARPPRTIHPYPNRVVWGAGRLRLAGPVRLQISEEVAPRLPELMADLWNRFTFGVLRLEIGRRGDLGPWEFVLGKADPPKLEPGARYALEVGPTGLAGQAQDPSAMRHAWYTLLQLLEAQSDGAGELAFVLPEVKIQDWPAIGFRGLHLCVFFETTPLAIEKAIRLAALFKFTHVVLEFWGMLRLETCKELSWPQAWSKAQARQLVELAQSLGLEVVPMFNCWGHASASRVKYGRHVVLDQNPRLAPWFEPDGWTWCLSNPHTRSLLSTVCDELIAWAGPGKYFHIGCDEAYSHATCERCRQADPVGLLVEHVNHLAGHLQRRGRRAIMWGDALLEQGKWPAGFSATSSAEMPTHRAVDRLSRDIVIADWHYGVTRGEVPTLAYFRRLGFETLACPWNTPANIQTLARAAAANGSGLLMTTWHHLARCIALLAWAANCAWSVQQSALQLPQCRGPLLRTATAACLRRLVPAEGDFHRAGWNPFEQPAETD